MKLTLFALPKPFHPPYDVIQENALRSWRALIPTPEIILFGDEFGTAGTAARFGLRHEPAVARNDLGTPLVGPLFRTATAHSTSPLQGYVNADIILDPSLPALLDKIHAWNPCSLITSRRWDFDVTSLIDFERPSSFPALAAEARTRGSLYSHHGMDLFIFPTGFFDRMPDFSIGWPGAKYDNWMIYEARRQRIPVVDITSALTIVHQNHPAGSGAAHPEKAKEHWINLDLLGGNGCCFDVLDATHAATADGSIVRVQRDATARRRDAFRLAQRIRYRFRKYFLGFSYAAAAGKLSNRG